ncbi:serine hydrolase domain-containing protein [Steroidobacter sp.]|uniref:serine hydrolase domain-containing protein n=1 Tax=Steroidobacter sp. TaxID=1978227 RepID=UPI001A3E2B8A|nr:serine hydrolase domain-containing protein [Steroidobacter sp.]MBL8267905.1 beta-lactamase family protein [Steroidobacter sp.]
MKSISLALLMVAALPSHAADRFDAARATIREQMVEASIPSVAVAVAYRGKIVWEQGFGWADKEQQIPATEHTMYSLASLTKPITVTGLMTLVQAGKLELDRPINDYLGDAKLRVRVGDPQAVTVRRVIDHSSGLPGGSQFFYGDERALTPSMEQTLLRYGDVVAVPGERWEYTNLGYGALGYVIERVSGQSYSEYLRSAVFMPLGMTHSAVDVGPELKRFQAVRYDRTRQPVPMYGFGEPGSAAAYSSAHDLVRLGMFFLKNRLRDQRPILNDAAVDQMTSASPSDDGGMIGTVGWQARKYGNYVAYGHAGSMAGVTTDLSMIPSQNLCVVMLVNASVGSKLYRMRDAVIQSVLPDWNSLPSQNAAPTPPPAFQPTAELQGEWSGKVHTYEGELPIRLRVLASGDVHVQIGSQRTTLLNNVTFEKGRLKGYALSQIPTGDTKRYPHEVALDLTLRGAVLNGSVAANNINDPKVNWVYGLPHWTELQRNSP